MNILYVSSLVSTNCINKLFENGYEPIQSMQKFNQLLVKGFISNGCRIDALSNIPIKMGKGSKFKYKRREEESGVLFDYCPLVVTRGLDNLITFIYSFFKTLKWVRNNNNNNNNKDSIIILDTLKLSLSAGALMASRMMGTKTVGIVTDIAGMIKFKGSGIKQRVASFIINQIMDFYDSYILLTEQMNEVMNSKQKAYIIMEGLVDIQMDKFDVSDSYNNKEKRFIMYAGGLYPQYGLRDLIRGFMRIDNPNIELHLYGHGNMIDEINEYSEKDSRVRYFGVVHNGKIVEAELGATLLVNPRPTTEDFTKYSFPSKNMEYMVSGTPVLTTVLPGMPIEYHDYVYLLEDETENGIYKKLNHILNELPEDELKQKGYNAKKFVLEKKNNIFQAEVVMEFIRKTFHINRQ